MAAWCQCGVPWFNIKFKFGPQRDVCATVPSVRDVQYEMILKMPHRIASHHIISACLVVAYSTPVLLSAGLVIIVSKDNSSRCCSVRLPGHWHTGTGGQNGKKTRDNGRLWALWRLSMFVSGWQQGVLCCTVGPTGTIPVKFQ